MNFIDKALEEYAAAAASAPPELLDQLAKATYANLHGAQMLTGRVEGRLLNLLAKLINAVNVLEIGLFSGYSALSMAEALPAHGRMISLEKNPDAYEFAKHYITQSSHGHKIEVHIGEALTILPTLDLPILDMVFLDADKRNNDNYFEFLFPKVRSNGLIVIDNTLYDGEILHPESPQAVAIDELNKKLAVDSRIEVVLLAVRDGISVIRKK